MEGTTKYYLISEGRREEKASKDTYCILDKDLMFILQSKAASRTHPAIQAATHDHACCFFEQNHSRMVIVQPSDHTVSPKSGIISTASSGNTHTTNYKDGTSITTSTFQIQETTSEPTHRYTTKRWLPILDGGCFPSSLPNNKKPRTEPHKKLWTDPYRTVTFLELNVNGQQ